MSHLSPSSLDQRLNDLKDEVEQQKIELTPDVKAYIQMHLDVVQEKISKGEGVTEDDMKFIDRVKDWVKCGGYFSTIEEMIDGMGSEFFEFDYAVEAHKRYLTLEQWAYFEVLAEGSNRGVDEWTNWIDEHFQFPEKGEILAEDLDFQHHDGQIILPDGLTVKGHLNLSGRGRLLDHLPKNLVVVKNLYLDGCTSLRDLSRGLVVYGNLYLSSNLQAKVKKDAERLKEEGKIKGKIKYID